MNNSDDDVRRQPMIHVALIGGRPVVRGDTLCNLGYCLTDDEKQADGVYVRWRWEGRRLVVENDPFGLYPLFYCAKSDSFACSPSLRQVVQANSDHGYDDAALSVFYRLGHFVEDDTPFQDVRALAPGSRLIWEDGRFSVSSEGRFSVVENDGIFDAEEAIEEYRMRFRRAVSRRLPANEDFVVPISGGRDSRHILLELVAQGARPKCCVTVKYRPPANNEDLRVGRALAARLGIPHVALDRPGSFFQSSLRDVHLTNYCGGGHGWVQPVADWMAENASTAFDGLAGDVLSAGHMYSPEKDGLLRSGRKVELASLLIDEACDERLLQAVFSESYLRRFPRELAVKRLAASLDVHSRAINPVASFNFMNRTRRCIASIPFAIMGRVERVLVPFVDRSLVGFLLRIHPSLTHGGGLHDEVIRRSYPDHAGFGYANKMAPVRYSVRDRYYYVQARAEFLGYLSKLKQSERVSIRSWAVGGKVLSELLMMRRSSPWHLRHVLQAVELGKLSTSDI